MVKTAYNATYRPPIPMLDVKPLMPDSATSVGPLPTVVDTGADVTLIPTTYLQQLNALIWDEALLRSHWGESRRIYTYLIDMQIDVHTLPGIVVVGDDQGQDIVLGRNVLNKLILLLDGPDTTLYTLSQRPHHLT